MNTALWIVQGLLAALFLMAGTMKTFKPIDELAVKMPWVKDVSVSLVRFVGVSQLLIALGLVLPWLTGIVPVLTGVAALGLALNMLFAALFHVKRSEWQALPMNLGIMALALFVAYGRLFYAPTCGV
ncbi:MAG TPA: DoxX family protein [Chitinophagales bacterium]|nr:DoxX family protein [Chitinophagales bacterium]